MMVELVLIWYWDRAIGLGDIPFIMVTSKIGIGIAIDVERRILLQGCKAPHAYFSGWSFKKDNFVEWRGHSVGYWHISSS